MSMALIGDFIDVPVPASPDDAGADVFERFQADPNVLAIAVVDAGGRPIGLVERHTFCLRMAAEFGRALYARRPISALMDTDPRLVEASAEADVWLESLDAADMAALLRGFVVVRDGRYVGVGTALQLLQAGLAVHRRRAEAMADLARDLTKAEAEARASSRAKSEFLAVMSHEIRTPLNGVLGVAGLMERELTQEALRPHVNTILDSGQTLLRLLTDALDMSRAEAGILTLEPAPLDVGALARDLVALWGPRAEEWGLALTVTAGLPEHDWVVADAMRLKQVLNNLIGNALKFTLSGGVEVTLGTAWLNGAVRLEAAVADTGPGIAPEAAATIFEPFNTGDAGREGAGAGLGLAICRQIVQAMGGTIGLASAPSGGARFHFCLDLPPAGPELRGAAKPLAAPTPHETLHVLVVDDNAANRFLAGRLLDLFGCTHEMAGNGQEAVEAASTRPFDIILMDIKMPVMDGMAATRAIRALPGAAGMVPVLALTANADPRDEALYRAAGMTGVAQKPIQPDALLDAIRRALGSGSGALEAAA
jgi:two-component system, sensor histidine kinase